MSGHLPACYGNNILITAQHPARSLPCLNGVLSLGKSPTVLPLSVPYPGQHCTTYVPGCCKTSCYGTKKVIKRK